MAKTSKGILHTTFTLSLYPRGGSWSGLKMVIQPEYFSPGGRTSGDPGGCPGESFTRDPQGEVT